MAKIPANPTALKHAWRDSVTRSTLPRKAQADAAGVAYSTWCAWADSEQPDALPPVRRLPVALSEALDDPAFVDYLASLQQRITVPVPDAAPCSETQLADMCHAFGAAIQHAAASIASHGWDTDEAAQHRRLTDRLVAAMLGFALWAEQVATPVDDAQPVRGLRQVAR